jgi:hypothetical protein
MDKELALFAYLGMVVVFILAWKPLHRRFRGWSVLSAYLLFALAMAAPIFAPHEHDAWKAFFVCMAAATITLLTGRQKPIEERRPTVAWAAIHGLWDQLAKDGIPADEIERLKKLTPEERARLMASLMASVERAKRGAQMKPKWEPDERFSGFSAYGDDYPSMYDGRW